VIAARWPRITAATHVSSGSSTVSPGPSKYALRTTTSALVIAPVCESSSAGAPSRCRLEPDLPSWSDGHLGGRGRTPAQRGFRPSAAGSAVAEVAGLAAALRPAQSASGSGDACRPALGIRGSAAPSAKSGIASPALEKTRYSGQIRQDAGRASEAPVALLAKSTSLVKPGATPALVRARASGADGAGSADYVQKKNASSTGETVVHCRIQESANVGAGCRSS
jgi:hypothetical protein